MFSNLFNYLVLPAMISIGTLGALFILNPEKANSIIESLAWNSVVIYSKSCIYFENLAESFNTGILEDFTDEEYVDEIKPLLSYYNYEECSEVHMGSDYSSLPEGWWKENEKNINLVIFKNQESVDLFKTFKNYRNFKKSDKDNWNKIEKQFVQIELIQNNNCIDIHKHLDLFYIGGNILFTPAFLKWYLHHWFNKTLNEDTYTLKIFDKDVNLFNLTSKQYIKITNNGYEIKNLDDESDSEDDHEQETKSESEHDEEEEETTSEDEPNSESASEYDEEEETTSDDESNNESESEHDEEEESITSYEGAERD